MGNPVRVRSRPRYCNRGQIRHKATVLSYCPARGSKRYGKAPDARDAEARISSLLKGFL